MKKFLFIILFTAGLIYAQVGVVELSNHVYNFLSRMNSMNFISNYDEFEIPKTRNQVVKYLNELIERKKDLSAVDQHILDELLLEFEFDLTYSTSNSTLLFPSIKYYEPFSDKEKYLYFFSDSSRFNLFANVLFEDNLIYSKNADENTKKVNLLKFGGRIRASFSNNFGFMIEGTNGTFNGSKSLAQSIGSLRYNYKFNDDKLGEGGVSFFDETTGYLMAEWDIIKFKIGRDRFNIGYGPIKSIIGSNAPDFDYISMNINYGIFGFSYFHGKLLGSTKDFVDPVQGLIRNIQEKYIAYHRFTLNFSRHIKLGLGEMVIYSNRSADFAYLNPFNYYKSAEHANRDRDNSMLFLDLENHSINGITFYTTVLIDDLDFGKFGTSFFGNQIMLEAGSKIIPAYSSLPIEIDLKYNRIDPYTFTHRIYNNNFSNDGYSLNDELHPNSDNFYIGITSQFHYRISASINFTFTRHGANDIINNKVVTNYGGNINVGHRQEDAVNVRFLDGKLEYLRKYGINIIMEPVNNYFIILTTHYINNKLPNDKNVKNISAGLALNIRI